MLGEEEFRKSAIKIVAAEKIFVKKRQSSASISKK
jgi:hypothetical protein